MKDHDPCEPLDDTIEELNCLKLAMQNMGDRIQELEEENAALRLELKDYRENTRRISEYGH